MTEDGDFEPAPIDRAYWEVRASKETLAIADRLLEIAREIDPQLQLHYRGRPFYIRLGRDGVALDCVLIVPQPKKSTVDLKIKLPQTTDLDVKIKQSGFVIEYDLQRGHYLLHVAADDLQSKADAVRDLMRLAHY